MRLAFLSSIGQTASRILLKTDCLSPITSLSSGTCFLFYFSVLFADSDTCCPLFALSVYIHCRFSIFPSDLERSNLIQDSEKDVPSTSKNVCHRNQTARHLSIDQNHERWIGSNHKTTWTMLMISHVFSVKLSNTNLLCYLCSCHI